MFEGVGVGEVRERLAAMRDLVGRLEPEAVALPEAPAMWQTFDGIERLAASAKTLLAARVDESGIWQRAGDRSAPEYLARKSGSALGSARTSLETSKRVRALPHTRSAMRRGELSRAQADEIAGAALADPGAERSLLDSVAGSSLNELRERCARTRAAADPDPDATQRRIHGQRRLRRWTDPEGAWNLSARGTPDAGARFNAELDPIIDELFGAARQEWRTPPLWGVRDSGPYLHDGRADTLEQAIALHGGQGAPSAQRYFLLTPKGRMQVQAFLKSLVAPPEPKQIARAGD